LSSGSLRLPGQIAPIEHGQHSHLDRHEIDDHRRKYPHLRTTSRATETGIRSDACLLSERQTKLQDEQRITSQASAARDYADLSPDWAELTATGPVSVDDLDESAYDFGDQAA
jgi:hypothetical protein